jgi:hypothetical protein
MATSYDLMRKYGKLRPKKKFPQILANFFVIKKGILQPRNLFLYCISAKKFNTKKFGWSLVLMNKFDFPLGTYTLMYILRQLMQIGEKLVNVPR